jgi:nucleoside-diphosphate-sugar epimerase
VVDSPLASVTGGSGFVGSHIIDSLLAAGYRVRALLRRPGAPGWLRARPVEIAQGDVQDSSTLKKFVAGASAIVHVAGKTSARDLREYRLANATGTENLVRATLEVAPKAHFVQISSLAAAGPSQGGGPVQLSDSPKPVSSYGISKLEGEIAVAAAPGLSYTILRPSAVYGPRETAIRDLFVLASKGWVPILAGGEPKVQLVYVTDVAACVLSALKKGASGETYFVAHPEILDYKIIARVLAALPNPPARTFPVPGNLIRGAGAVSEIFGRFASGPPVFNREKAAEMLQDAWTCDVSRTQTDLGMPLGVPFSTGSRLTWDWYRQEGWIRVRGGI